MDEDRVSRLALREASVAPARVGSEPEALLAIRLLGGFEIRDRTGAVLSFGTRKAEALMALLALRPERAYARETVCALLWPEVRDVQARHSLRQTLVVVRKALPADSAALLLAQARSLALDPTRVSVDVSQVEKQLRIGSPEALLAASALYRGSLLDGFSIDEAPFEQWLTLERQRLHVAQLNGLSRLLELQTNGGQIGEAISTGTKLLRLEPLHEQTHRALMRLYVRQGHRTAALYQYQSFARLLRSELDVAPEAETERLFAELSQPGGNVRSFAAPSAAFAETTWPATWQQPPTRPAYVIGRSAELQALQDALNAAARAKGGVTLLLGEAGVGKTHLCEWFAAEAHSAGTRVLRARCFESEQILPFSLWVNLLQHARLREDPSLLAALPQALRAEIAQLLPDATTREPNPDRMRSVLPLFQALQLLIARLAAPGPLLLVFEDLHWADEMSLRALCFLSRPHTSEGTCLMLGTAREEELTASPFLRTAIGELDRDRLLHRVALAPLSRMDTEALAQRSSGELPLGTLRALPLDQIWAISEGNPLVIVESTRHLLPVDESTPLPSQASIARDVTQLSVPERVRALILNRIERSSSAARELLSLAAVIGRELEFELLRGSVPDDSALLGSLEELVAASWLRVDDDRIYFSHDRFRETIYDALLPPRRRVLHAAAAAALESHYAGNLDQVLGPLGYHYSKAGSASAAISYLIRFADQASRSHGAGEALAALDQALQDSAQLPPEQRDPLGFEILSRQTFCLIFLGRYAELVRRMRQHQPHVEALGNPWFTGGINFALAAALTVLGRMREANAHSERALIEAQACDALTLARAHMLRAFVCAFTGRFAEGIQHGSKAIELQAQVAELPEGVVLARFSLAMNHCLRGDWQTALAVCETAEATRISGSLRAQSLLAGAHAFVLYHAEHWQPALAACQRELALSVNPIMQARTLALEGWLILGSGRVEQAIALLERALTELEQRGMRIWTGWTMTKLAEALLLTDDLEGCQRVTCEALTILRESGDPYGVGCALQVLGRHALTLGDWALAQSQLLEALQLFETSGAGVQIAHTRQLLAQLAMAQSNLALATESLGLARAGFMTHHMDHALARVDAMLDELRALGSAPAS